MAGLALTAALVAAQTAAGSPLAVAKAADPALTLLTATGHTVKIEPWGANALRVRAALGGGAIQELPGALIPPGSDNKGWPLAGSGSGGAELSRSGSGITNGNIAASVDGTTGLVSVTRVSDGATVLQELAREVQGSGSPPAPPSPKPSDDTRTIAVNNTAADCACGQGKGKPCCLDVSNWNKADNAPVLASSCNYPPVGPNGVGNQRWSLESDGTIKVALDGKCLTTASATRPDADNHGKGTAVTVATCKPGDKSQQWSAGAGGSGPLKSGGKCLALEKSGARMQCGAGYTLEACDPSNQLQQWTVEAAIAPPAPPAPPKPKLTLLSFAAKQDDKIFGICRQPDISSFLLHLDFKQLALVQGLASTSRGTSTTKARSTTWNRASSTANRTAARSACPGCSPHRLPRPAASSSSTDCSGTVSPQLLPL